MKAIARQGKARHIRHPTRHALFIFPLIRPTTMMMTRRRRFAAAATALVIHRGSVLPSDGFSLRSLPIRPWPLLMVAPSANNNEDVKSRKSIFRRFEDEVLDRIAYAQSKVDCNAREIYEEVRPPVIDYDSLVKMADSTSSNESRRHLELALSNGYFLLKLNENDAKIVGDLWKSAEEIFDLKDLPLRHQTLVREGTSTDKESYNNGYKYIETTRRRRDGAFMLLPNDGTENLIGKERKEVFFEAYNLLGDVGLRAATAFLKVSVNVDASDINNLMELLSDYGQVSEHFNDEDSELSCTMQRICNYSSLSEIDSSEERETLRPHTDWTLATLVPVSAVPGLEVWDSRVATWVRPEALDILSAKHSNYIIVMAGKWLELISMGKIQAAIHRVIASKGRNRFSTPFFYRPRQYIPSLLQAQYGEATNEIEGTSQEEMGRFLHTIVLRA